MKSAFLSMHKEYREDIEEKVDSKTGWGKFKEKVDKW